MYKGYSDDVDKMSYLKQCENDAYNSGMSYKDVLLSPLHQELLEVQYRLGHDGMNRYRNNDFSALNERVQAVNHALCLSTTHNHFGILHDSDKGTYDVFLTGKPSSGKTGLGRKRVMVFEKPCTSASDALELLNEKIDSGEVSKMFWASEYLFHPEFRHD